MGSPKQNRVTPMGDLVAVPLRGAWTGNRGNLHQGTDIVRFHRSSLWITCALAFKDWWHPQWVPRRFTWLFFHDEAVAFAAGHRPCALCRREAYNAYRRAWATGHGGEARYARQAKPESLPLAKEMDRQLHGERIVRGSHRRRLHDGRWPDLPAGTFVLLEGAPAVVLAGAVVPWTVAGYGRPRDRPRRGRATVVTPPSTVAAFRAGYRPQVDPAAAQYE